MRESKNADKQNCGAQGDENHPKMGSAIGGQQCVVHGRQLALPLRSPPGWWRHQSRNNLRGVEWVLLRHGRHTCDLFDTERKNVAGRLV